MVYLPVCVTYVMPTFLCVMYVMFDRTCNPNVCQGFKCSKFLVIFIFVFHSAVDPESVGFDVEHSMSITCLS